MKKLVAALVFGASLMGVASADTIQNGYGNTFVVTTAQGAAVRYHFDADNTFHVTAPDGSTSSGTYTLANGQLCLTSAAGGAAQCSAYVGDKNVGDTWTQTAGDGSTITVSLQAGR